MSKEIHLLLVDDDPDDIEIFQLASHDIDATIRITTAGNGEEALEILSKGLNPHPDIIFLDLNMPRMGGKQFLDEINRNRIIPDIPIIVYSTSGQPSDIRYMPTNGAMCFITKAANIKRLTLILSKVAEGLHGDLLSSLRSIVQLTSDITCNSTQNLRKA